MSYDQARATGSVTYNEAKSKKRDEETPASPKTETEEEEEEVEIPQLTWPVAVASLVIITVVRRYLHFRPYDAFLS